MTLYPYLPSFDVKVPLLQEMLREALRRLLSGSHSAG